MSWPRAPSTGQRRVACSMRRGTPRRRRPAAGAALLRPGDGGHVLLTLAYGASSELRRSETDLFPCEGAVVVRAAESVGDAPLICTDGQPSTACDALLRQVAPVRAAVRHSGDFDWGGLRIAAPMRRRYGARSWRHG